MAQSQRAKGTGGIHFRTSDQLWIGEVAFGYANGKRNRRRVSSKSREKVEAKVAALLAMPNTLRAPTPQRRPGLPSHDEQVATGDRQESHTLEQWLAKLAAIGCCIYCGTAGGLTVDHAVPLSRGGSNGIGNVVPSCHSCNVSKGNLTAAEFVRERAMGVR